MDKRGVQAWAVLSALLTCWLAAGDCPAQSEVEAITEPSEDRTLSFVTPGLIATMAVIDEKTGRAGAELKEGNVVKAGQVLVRLDDKVEQAQAEQLKAKADDTIRVDAQVAKLEQAKVDHKKFKEAFDRGAATALEVEHARLDVTIADLSLKLARFEQSQAKLEHKQKVLQIERMSIRSPIDGVVEEIFRRPGEAVNALEKVLRVVKIDPLWIDVPVPREQADTLRRGGRARVDFRLGAGEGGAKRGIVEGKIIHIAAVADAASATRTVRVEVPNRLGRPAKENVTVRFLAPEEVAGAAPDPPPAALGGRN